MSGSIRTDLFRPFKDVVSRSGKLKKNDRGLPEEQARHDLARTYLELQNQLWPELVGTGLLSPVSDEAVKNHADSFRESFVSGIIKVINIPVGLIIAIAAAYVRYSCDNSNPRSLAQQLRNILESAKKKGYFVPWAYVFGDAAISGTTSDRRGYQMCKELVRQPGIQLECLLVDEIGRANRNTIESLMLGRLVEHYNKRLVGVTDGLDSRQAQFQTQLVMFSLMQQLFVEWLREKVNRGMKDKFLLGGNIRPPALGYKIVQVKTPEGNLIIKSNGKIETERVIDEDDAAEVRQAFWRFAMEGWSLGRVARDFCSRCVGRSRSWDASNIIKMLERETYVGREHDGMTRKEMNPETGIIKTIKLPREQWRSREVPHMRIIDDTLWEKTKRRLELCREAQKARKDGQKSNAGIQVSRAHVYPRMLVRPICSHCKTELSIGGSGKYSSLCCLNGSRGKKECPLGTFKSIRMIEKAMMEFLTKEIITKSFLEGVIMDANDFLEQERLRPRKNISNEPEGLRDLINRRDHLSEMVEQHGAQDIVILINRLRELERQIAELKANHESERLKCLPPPPPITISDLGSLVADLTDLLKDDVAKAAPIIRQLLGDVEVEDVKDNNKTRPVWIARFNMNAGPFMLELAKSGNLPNTECWEYLTQRNWKFTKSASISIREVPIYELIAPEVMSLKSQGLSDEVIARRLGTTTTNVRDARIFATLGVRPKAGSARKRTGTGIVIKYKEIADEVVYLRDVKMMHFHDIAELKKCSEATVRRAYDFKKPEVIQFAASRGVRPRRGRSIRLKPEVLEEMRRLINLRTLSDYEIGRRCKCGANTVGRERRNIEAEKRSA